MVTYISFNEGASERVRVPFFFCSQMYFCPNGSFVSPGTMGASGFHGTWKCMDLKKCLYIYTHIHNHEWEKLWINIWDWKCMWEQFQFQINQFRGQNAGAECVCVRRATWKFGYTLDSLSETQIHKWYSGDLLTVQPRTRSVPRMFLLDRICTSVNAHFWGIGNFHGDEIALLHLWIVGFLHAKLFSVFFSPLQRESARLCMDIFNI